MYFIGTEMPSRESSHFRVHPPSVHVEQQPSTNQTTYYSSGSRYVKSTENLTSITQGIEKRQVEWNEPLERRLGDSIGMTFDLLKMRIRELEEETVK